MTGHSFSRSDLRILTVLQEEGRIANVDLAERVGMSASPCLRRVRQLEADGVITGYRATLDPKALGLGIEAFVQINIERHRDEDTEAFRRAVLARPEVVACYIMTGEMDFLLHIRVADLEAYGAFAMGHLVRLPGVKDVKSSFVLETVKPPQRLPLPDFA